jgi:hypothetical protein
MESYIYPKIIPEENEYINILLIDCNVVNYERFVKSANFSTLPIVYSTNSSKADLFQLLKNNFTFISRIGICFESSLEKSKPFLDNELLFLDDETTPYSKNVKFLLDIISQFQVKNIDFLTCKTLNYPNWVNYYKFLEEQTGVIVGASNTKTGNNKYGGDWIMQSTGENIKFIYFNKSIEIYTYLL